MDLVSVILSTYNESCSMISESIDSIINQTYTNLEIILINDNPNRPDLDELLLTYERNDNRVRYIKNKNNTGLVSSLNEGIRIARGEFIARMDADDISDTQRIYKQMAYIKAFNYDIVGSCILKIDETGKKIGFLYVPSKHKDIIKFMKYGSCVLHPTWLVRRKAYIELNGYREVVACEDYDFLVRAIDRGFLLGNVPEVALKYRVRSVGVSQSTYVRQMLTMYFIASCKTIPSKNEIDEYLASQEYLNEKTKYERYEELKFDFKNGNVCNLFYMVLNKYFYVNIKASVAQRLRRLFIVSE